MNYRVLPVSSKIADDVRQTMISPFGGLPAFSSVATGYGPCRSCLKTFRQGQEDRIYITFNPFDGHSDLPLPGPVFIHSEPCAEYDVDAFPEAILSIPMIFEGFGENSRLVISEPADVEKLDEQIERILAMTDVRSIHIRNAEAGCFIARIVAT